MAQLQPTIYLADRPAEELRQKPADDLKQKFVELVMCDFTPRHPSELPASRWVSFDRLYQLFQPHAAVSQRGPGNLRLRIIEWYKDDPAFIGLDPREWCKRVTSKDAPQNGSGKTYLWCTSFASSTLRDCTCLASEVRCALAVSHTKVGRASRALTAKAALLLLVLCTVSV